VQTWLDERFATVLHVDQGHNSMRLYATGDEVATVSPGFQPQAVPDSQPGEAVLAGYDVPTHEHRPGDRLNLGLYVRTEPAASLLGVDWIGPGGSTVARQRIEVPVLPDEDAVVRTIAPFAVYSYTAPGRYWAEVYVLDGGSSPADGASVRLPVGRVTQSRRLPKPGNVEPLQVALGGGRVRLLGYDLEPEEEVRIGEPLTVKLQWQAVEALERDYTVFVHLVGGYNPATGGPVWAQDDSYPLQGGHPTTRWLPGQVVVDRHVIEVLPSTPPGRYQIYVGLYNALTGERLRVTDADTDRIVIGEIELY
jgi:hypothetical protein